MKNFVELFKQRHDKELNTLMITANVAGREYPDEWGEYVKTQIAIIMLNDDALSDKLVDSVCEMMVKQFKLMPDLNYQLTDEEKAICALAKLAVGMEKENK